MPLPASAPASPRSRPRPATEPRWRPLRHFTSATLAPRLRLWLTDNGSLTERLAGSGYGAFSVRRLHQGWEVPLPSERRLLRTPPGQLALVREVALLLGNDAVVFARSVFPLASLNGSLAHLRRLQNRSLGAILFKHPHMCRSPFELARMPGNSAYLPEHLRQQEHAWGRRSRFVIDGKSVMVSEVFLGAFRPWTITRTAQRSQRGRIRAAFRSPTQ